MQHHLQQLAGGNATGGRKQRDPDSRAHGLTCEHCGAELPPGVTIRREFCDRKCRSAHYNAQDRAQRIAERQDRKCLWCLGPIPAEARGGTIYCGKSCQTRSQIDMQKPRGTCPQCGSRFRGHGRFCSHRCFTRSRVTLHPKSCPICAQTFKPHRAEQVCCSQTCRHELARRSK